MHGNMARLRRHNALIVPQHGGNDGGIGLGAAGKQVHIGPGTAAGRLDFFAGRCGEDVFPVAGFLLEIGGHQALQNAGMGALRVITSKGNHRFAISSTGQWSEPKISL